VILESENKKPGGNSMVKGVARRVIVVKAPDKRLFEQAIFIVKEDAFAQEGVTEEQVLAEAQRVADGYVRRHNRLGKRLWRIPAPAYAAAGAAAATAIWALTLIW
jgi:hypothetical protein